MYSEKIRQDYFGGIRLNLRYRAVLDGKVHETRYSPMRPMRSATEEMTLHLCILLNHAWTDSLIIIFASYFQIVIVWWKDEGLLFISSLVFFLQEHVVHLSPVCELQQPAGICEEHRREGSVHGRRRPQPGHACESPDTNTTAPFPRSRLY